MTTQLIALAQALAPLAAAALQAAVTVWTTVWTVRHTRRAAAAPTAVEPPATGRPPDHRAADARPE